MLRLLGSLLLLALLCPPLAAQEAARVAREVRAWRAQNEHAVLRELRGLLAVPNLAADRENIARNAALLRQMLEKRGVQTRLLTVGDAPPAVYGELQTPGATRTVVFYAHYDGQPVDPERWASPPFTPTLRDQSLEEGGQVVAWDALPASVPGEYRLYARSASDDKGPIVAALAALDALRAAAIPLSVNLKFFLEGEEEAGSPHLEQMLRAHRDLLAADLWVLGDGPVHQSRRMQLTFGVRGAFDLEMTTYGPLRGLHSGHYGNWAPNPAMELAHILAGMRDTDGRILISGFARHVRPLSEAERAALDQVPAVEEQLQHDFGLGRVEKVRPRLVDAITMPAINLRGIRSAYVGEQAANAIPTEAQASFDFRLVPDLLPQHVRELVEAHLRKRGYHIVHDTPDASTRRAHPRLVKLQWGSGYAGYRTSMDLPASQAVIQVVEQALGAPAVKLPNAGGSLPLYLFDEVLRTPLLIVPIVNHDNSQHAADENLRLQNLWDGIEIYAALFARLGAEWE